MSSVHFVAITLRSNMCNQNTLKRHIARFTNNGEDVARFLAETMRGETPGAKACHRFEAAKLLNRYTESDESDHEDSPFWGLAPTPEELAAKKNTPSPPSMSDSVTHLDILNYEIAHLIRQETAEGHTIAEFLAHVLTGRDKPYTPKKLRIKPADRMAASREILNRGHGHFGRKRKLVIDDYDTLHTDLAKRMREYTEHGTDAIRFLLDVMSEADPEAGFTWHHRTSAAQELLRRSWDTNYDKITPEMLQDYWRNQKSPRLSVGQKKHLANLPTTLDDYNTYDNKDYQAIADAIREQEDREAASAPGNSPLSPRERVRVRGPENTLSTSEEQGSDKAEQSEKSPSSPPSMSVAPDFDDTPDCYHEPLNPDDQAIFDYQTQIESGEYDEGEITIRQPTPEDWKAYEYALRYITELAASEGVSLLPNPLAGALNHPNIRSP